MEQQVAHKAPDHNRQKKIAVINDMTGFGRCSLAVAIPIISKLRVQCCPLPTAVLSNHTGFSSWYIDDGTRYFERYAAEWKKLDLRFHGIATGFLGSKEQFGLVGRFLDEFRTAGTIVAVDPVMGDYGRTYTGYTEEMCAGMRELAAKADIITPNLTEACILTDTPYRPSGWHMKELDRILEKLSALGPKKIVITGIPQGAFIANLCMCEGKRLHLTRQYRVGEQRSGTGDIFSSVIIADAVNGVDFETSVRKASRFVKKCIMRSIELGIPTTDGVAFEEVLDALH